MTGYPWWLTTDPDAVSDDPSAVKMRRVDTPFVIICDRGHFREIKPPESGDEVQTWIRRHAQCQTVTPRHAWQVRLTVVAYFTFLCVAWWLIDDRMGRGDSFVDQLRFVGIWVAVFATYNLSRSLVQAMRKKLKR